MMISTKGRYALQVMADMADHGNGELIPLKEITDRLDISQKYAESIMSTLSKGNLVESASGKHGGYKLIKKPEEYSIGEILLLTEGDLTPVSCSGIGTQNCERSHTCYTQPFWAGLTDVINDYLNSHTLADITKKYNEL